MYVKDHPGHSQPIILPSSPKSSVYRREGEAWQEGGSLTCPKPPELGLESSSHPQGVLASAPEWPPPAQRGQEGLPGLLFILFALFSLTGLSEMVSCLRMVIILCVGYCKLRCVWLYCGFVRVGLCKPPLWAHFSNVCSFCLHDHLSGMPFLPSFIQVVPVHPSDQPSPHPVFPAPSCPLVIALTLW